MRIDLVSVVNFGSHAAKSWQPDDARLTVVTGPNGAGKSTLFVDAPCWALFGEVPGSYSPDELVRIGATDMSVTLELTLDGVRHRFIRRRTLRAGGKTSADAQQRLPDGTWKPLASGSREVSAEAARILRMDQHTFRTVVVIAQGDAKRFMDATPGKGTPTAPGRAAILSTLVVDPAFALAEVRARDEARTLEATVAMDRSTLERLDDAIAELEPVVGILAERRDEASAIAADIEQRRAARDAAEDRLRGLEAKLADASPTADAIARVEAEVAELVARHRTVSARKAASTAAIATVEATLADASAVDEADDLLPVLRLEVKQLERVEASDAALVAQHRAKLDELAEIEKPYEIEHATWSVEWKNAKKRVAEAEDHGRAGTSICQACGQPIEQKVALEQLAAARATLRELEAAEPKRPLSIDRIKAEIVRLESKQRELDWDPGILLEARRQLAEAERTAARGEAIAAARRRLDDERSAIVEADAELTTIGAAGQAARSRLEELNATQAGLVGLGAERDEAMLEVTRIRADIEGLEVRGRDVDRHVARLEADVTRLETMRAEHDTISSTLAGAEHALALLRRMATALGVKGIPARVVEGVLPELVDYANDMLGQLRPGMTLDLRATRAKADGTGTIEALDIWIRDHRGERQRWSGGEGTSIAMSIAVGLSRLGAQRSGARVATQIIDEPDGLDHDSRRAFGEAALILAHWGDLERVAVITHQDGIPDFADAVIELEPVIESIDSIGLVA